MDVERFAGQLRHCTALTGGVHGRTCPRRARVKGADGQRWGEQHRGPGPAAWAQARGLQSAA